jgi:hypothetical protein
MLSGIGRQEQQMGRLTYDSTTSIEFDDRALAHLQIVIGTKLRRSESFYFSWADDPSMGDGRNVIWLHPSMPLRFRYDGSRRPGINRAWIESLMAAANSTEGLRVTPEPAESAEGVHEHLMRA